MPSSGYTAITFVADQLLTSTVMNQMAANDAAFNNGNGFEDNIIVNRHMADDSVTGDNLSLDTVQSSFSGSGYYSTSSTSYQDTGFKITLPAIGTWLLLGQVRSLSPASGNYGVVQLYNFTTSTAVPQTERLSSYGSVANERQHPPMFAVLTTTTTNNSVGFRIKAGGAYTHTIENDPNGYSSLTAVRIG